MKMIAVLSVLLIGCGQQGSSAWFDVTGAQVTEGPDLVYVDAEGHAWGVQPDDGKIVCLFGQWYTEQIGDRAVWPDAPPRWVACSIAEGAFMVRAEGSEIIMIYDQPTVAIEDIQVLDGYPEPYVGPLTLQAID